MSFRLRLSALATHVDDADRPRVTRGRPALVHARVARA
jgi:hypothetical protein